MFHCGVVLTVVCTICNCVWSTVSAFYKYAHNKLSNRSLSSRSVDTVDSKNHLKFCSLTPDSSTRTSRWWACDHQSLSKYFFSWESNFLTSSPYVADLSLITRSTALCFFLTWRNLRITFEMDMKSLNDVHHVMYVYRRKVPSLERKNCLTAISELAINEM